MNIDSQSKYLLGIDVGTSNAKAVIIDDRGNLISWENEEYPILSPKPDWAEQNPETWLDAVLKTILTVMRKSGISAHQIAGIGLAGQMHGLVCLGKNGEPLRPAIIWADRRSKAEVRQIETEIGHEKIAEWLGNPLATGFMLPSWLWLVSNEPRIAELTHYLVLPKDYVRYRLTGIIGAEPSDASSTLLFDPHKRSWCIPLLKKIGLSVDRLPMIHESWEIAGGLIPEIAQKCGLSSGTPVVFGGSDVSLQALGQGVIDPGQVSCTIGTGGQLFAPISQPVHDSDLRMHFFCHVLPDRWHLETATLSAGLALRWLRDQMWSDQTYTSLADAAQQVEAAAHGLFFLPYLVGERTPIMDPEVRAAYIGLGLEHGRAHIVRATMEGVIFALRQGLDLIRETGLVPRSLIATGASIKHPLWLQLQADIFNLPITPANTPQATGHGAALLAGKGIGVFSDHLCLTAGIGKMGTAPIQPRQKYVDLYQRAFEEYCTLYPAIKKIDVQMK